MIEEIAKKYLGLEFIKIKRILIGSQNKTYLINNKYILKIFNFSSVSNKKMRENKEEVANLFNKNGVNSIVAFKINGTYLQKYENTYFCLYPFLEYRALYDYEISKEYINNLSKQVFLMHNLDINIELPETHNRQLKCNFEKYLSQFFEIDRELHNIVEDNIIFLNDLLNEINKSIYKLKSKKVLSHNDLKNDNIFWKQKAPYFLDFDACCFSNKYCALNEYAYFYCKVNSKLDKDLYELYIDNNLVNDNNIDDSKSIIYGTLYGKMSWLIYNFDRVLSDEYEEYLTGRNTIISMLALFKDYLSNKDYMIEVIDKYKKDSH